MHYLYFMFIIYLNYTNTNFNELFAGYFYKILFITSRSIQKNLSKIIISIIFGHL